MRQWQITNEWSFDGLELTDAPMPEPGPGEVLLKMKAVALNFRDYLMVNHAYGSMSGDLPLVPLSDGVGEVVALGDGVVDMAMGSRRVPCFNQAWLSGGLENYMWSNVLGGPLDGTARQYMTVPVESSVAVPDHLSDAEAATFCCAAITAWNALAEVPDAKTVVCQGTGGVSLFAVQFAKARGARVIATSSSPEKLERLRTLGADDVINYRETPDWGKVVLALTDGDGADLVVDVAGGATLKQSMRTTRPNGTITTMGNVDNSLAEINLPHLFMFRKRLIGISTGCAADFHAMMAHVDKTGMRPILDPQAYAFDDLKTALIGMPDGNHFGKMVVHIDP